MKIAITGIRGIPSNYGGFETFAENLSVRLAARGHDVTVYGRSNNIKTKERRYKGVELIILPTISHKYLDTVVHTWLCVLHSVFFRHYDIILICNAANAAFSWMPRLVRTKTVLNVDGIERLRRKWNRLGKAYYRLSEWLATFMPTVVVTDAETIKEYYQKSYNKESVMIPYGAGVGRTSEGASLLEKYGLQPDCYVLYVSRLEPENNADLVIKAYEEVSSSMPLVIVGDAPYAPDYIGELNKTPDKRVKFTGMVRGQDYEALQQNAFCYVQATEVGGTHPALLEAMGFGNCVLALDRPEHREVGRDSILYFSDPGDLAKKLTVIINEPDHRHERQARAMTRISQAYSWERVTDQYENLFVTLLPKPAARDAESPPS